MKASNNVEDMRVETTELVNARRLWLLSELPELETGLALFRLSYPEDYVEAPHARLPVRDSDASQVDGHASIPDYVIGGFCLQWFVGFRK